LKTRGDKHACAPKRYRGHESLPLKSVRNRKANGRAGIGATPQDQVGYFLSPFDFLKQLLTFFLFNAAFRRLVLFLLFIFASKEISRLVAWSSGH